MSLDEQYLDFSAKTAPIFARYPHLEGIRYSIFNEIFAQRIKATGQDTLKQWVRPLVRRDRTQGTLDPADVLIWIESQRSTVVETPLDVYNAITARGINARLVAFHGPGNLPPQVARFAFRAHIQPPTWAGQAWDAFCGLYPDMDEAGLRRAFLYACATAEGLFDELDRVLNAVRPKITLILSTQLIGGASLAVASREHSVLSLLLQHGILQPFYTPVVTDYMLTWGESSNDIVQPMGVPAEKLITIGSPRHDKMKPSFNGKNRAAFLETLNLPDRPTLIFFSNGNDFVRNGNAPVECAEWLEAAAAQYADQINVVVRLHPNEDGSLYANCPHLRITKNTPDLDTTLDACDWTASLCSTVLYEGLLYRKPVWQFYADGWPDLANNWKTGLATRIASQNQLCSIINEALHNNPGVDERVVERVFKNHGRATAAVVDLVERQLHEGGL